MKTDALPSFNVGSRFWLAQCANERDSATSILDEKTIQA
jgi:hypothetical protein